ncbi:MAG TPA: glycosyltransferase, partial [Ignavibacteria bacterium]|nr:glycosyltransferase [Ignavibacteria bacterium]
MDCIRSLAVFENVVKYEVIIVDNFSSGNSREQINMLLKENSNISAIYTESLIGFSAANNLGIKASNPDIIFTEPVFARLIDYMQSNTTCGAICPALVGTDGNFQRNYFQRFPTIRQFIYYNSAIAGLFNKSASRMNRFLENQDIDISTGKVYFTEQIPCAFFFTQRSFLSEVGLMDESYRLFFEDVDLSWKIGKKHRLAVDTGIKIIHLGGSSFKTENNWWLYGRY